MKVLMISGDNHLLDPASEAGKRLALQRAQVEVLDIFVWPQIASIISIYRAARKNHYDVVTAQDPFWRGLVGWKCAWFSGGALNVQVHTDLAHESALRRMIGKVVLRRADSVRVVSEEGKRAVEALGVKSPITILPVFIDTAPFAGLPRVPHAGKTILWVGRFEPEKDPLAAIAAFKEIHAAIPDARLIILGAGSLAEAVKNAARSLPVEFPGWQAPQEYLPAADLVLSTSRFESYGASIIEALAAGVAVVAPPVGAAQEAGAIIAQNSKLAEAAITALKEGTYGALRLPQPSAAEWAKRWHESLESPRMLESRA